MVLAWDVARRNRELRELASSRPREVMNLVRGFIDAGADVEELRAFGDSELAVTEILSLPPRKRPGQNSCHCCYLWQVLWAVARALPPAV